MRLWKRLTLAVLCAAAAAFGEPAEAVNRTPPEVYARSIAPLLTPLDTVLAGRSAFPAADNEGAILVSETVHFRDADGTLYRAQHYVYHALAQSAVEGMGSSIQRFDRDRETLYLVTAATILADGTRVPVEDKGAFIQTPQHEAANSLYTSQAELNLIFPSVATGTSTEVIVLVRENTAVMPGEFCLNYTFAAGWPSFRRRLVVELPADEWARMRTLATSPALPAPAEETPAPGRVRRTWTQSLAPRSHWEESAPSGEFCQPTVWLTTLPDWDKLAAWFQGLVAARSDLGPEVAAEVDKLTAGLTAPAAIVDALHTAVANEVRYTGLEFGLAGYQPYPCREVWQRRYGDCKDKANLLRAMLAHKGVRAHLVLISTDSLGRVERASPSWRQFNHAIVAVEDGAGGYRFCDPTIKHLPAGMPGMGDLGRDVLVLRDGRAEWARTPEANGAAIRISADLALAADGELSGWFTFAAEGSDAAYYTEYFNGQERRDRLRAMQRTIERFVPGAEVADIDYTPGTGAVRDFRLRAYLRRPPRATGGDALNFPYPTAWLPELTTVGERRNPYATTPREESVEAKIALPAGWGPAQLPPEFTAPSDAASFSAKWEHRDGALFATLRWRPKKPELAAAEYPVLQRSVRALTAWLAQPLTLRHDETAAAPAAAAPAGGPAELAQFPVLPTGEGQLRLLDEKFPEDENDTVRRAALERVLQWFPQDFETVFTAQVSLLRLERETLPPKTYADRLAALTARYGTKVSLVARAWAEFLEAQARWKADKSKPALERMRRLAGDEALPPFRRGWAAYETGRYLGESNPKEAAKYLAPFGGFACDAQADILALTATLLLQAGDAPGFEKILAEIPAKKDDGADAVFGKIVGRLEKHWEEVPAAVRRGALDALARTVGAGERYPESAKQLAQMKAGVLAGDAQKQFARELGAWLKAHPPKWWTKKKDPKLADAAAAIARIKARNDAKDATGVADATLQLVLHHEAKFAEFAEYVRWTLWWLDRADLDEELSRQLTRLSFDLPVEASTEVAEIWSTAAEHRAKKGDAVGVRELYERIFATPGVKDYQRAEAMGELGHFERKLGRIDEALAAYRRLEPIHTRHRHGIDYLYAALLLNVERGELDRAAEQVAQIARQEQKYIDEAANTVPLVALLRASKDPAALKNYWRGFRRWRKQWDAFLASAGVAPAPAHELPLAVDWTAQNDLVAKAVAARDVPGYLRALESDVRVAAVVPLVAGNLVNHVVRGSFLPDAQRKKLFECALALVAGLDPVDPEFDETGKLWETALLADVGRPADAATKARQLVQRIGAEKPVGQAALRVWTMSARTDADRKAAAAAMSALLESDTATPERTLTVGTFSDLLLAMKDRPRHLALLERETARADFDRSGAIARTLLARLAQLRSEGASDAGFTKFVREWSAAPGREWVQQLAPKTLAEPRFADQREPMAYDAKGFPEAERAKYNLLLALDERIELRSRETAFRNAAWSVANASNDFEAFATDLLRTLDAGALAEDGRSYLLRMAVWQLSLGRRPALLKKFRDRPEFGAQSESYRQSIGSIIAALERLDAKDASAKREAFTILTRQPLDALRNNLLRELLQDLVLAGEAQTANELLAGSDALQVDPTLEQSPATLLLQWTRAVREAREVAPFVRSLAALVETLPGSRTDPSVRARNLMYLEHRAALLPDEQIALVGDRLRRNDRVTASLSELLQLLLDSQIGNARQRAMGCDLFDQLAGLPMGDATRASLIFPTVALSDCDDPDVRGRIEHGLAQLLAPDAAAAKPQTAQAATFVRMSFALRSDPSERPDALFDPSLTKHLPQRLAQLAQLRFHSSRGQTAHLDSMLATVDPAMIAEFGLYGHVRAHLQGAGHEAEFKLFERAALDVLRRKSNELWLQPQDSVTRTLVFSLAELGNLGEQVPDALFERLAAVTRHPLARAQLELHRAQIRRDWPKLKDAADELLRLVPTMYDIHFYRAEAEHALGLKDAARRDFDVFLKFARDNHRYQEAARLRRTLDESGKP